MFEYKVRCRYKLGWKEIKLYADTDIEEFFNRNSIDYVRNMTDTVEHRQLKEIERLNNIIDEADTKNLELIQWLEVNIENLKRQKANNLYMEGVKQGMIKNADLILGKVRDLLDKEE